MNGRDSGAKLPELARRLSAMRTVTVTELQRHFGRILREVEQGQRFVITRRGRPIADLVPAREPVPALGAAEPGQGESEQ